jgi:probable rRNA maturation factor
MEIEVSKKIFDQRLSVSFIKKVLKKALKFFKKEISLSVVLVGKKTIRFLNRKYRGKDKVTDVLSFNYSLTAPKLKKDQIFGEIIICWPVVKKQAKLYQVDVQEELARVLIHGLLHLYGYDHRKKKEKKIMENKMNQIMKKIL